MRSRVLVTISACGLAVVVASGVLCLILRDDSPSPGAERVISGKQSARVEARHRAKAMRIDRGRDIPPEDVDPDSPPETDVDDAGIQVNPPDQTAIQQSDTAALCKNLGERIRSGESPETIAISAELVRRGNGCLEELKALLNSGNPLAETAAMRILVSTGTAESISAAIAKIWAEPSGDSRGSLLKVFGSARSGVVSGAIVDMIAAEKRPECLAKLKDILCAMEGPEVVESLAKRIAEETDQAVLANCLDVLAGMSRPSNTAALENVLAADKREEVQAAVAGALAGTGDSRACAILASNAVMNIYCEKALADVRSPYAQRALMDMASGTMNRNVRCAAIRALSHFNAPEVKTCLQSVEEKERDVRVLDAIKLTLSGFDTTPGTP